MLIIAVVILAITIGYTFITPETERTAQINSVLEFLDLKEAGNAVAITPSDVAASEKKPSPMQKKAAEKLKAMKETAANKPPTPPTPPKPFKTPKHTPVVDDSWSAPADGIYNLNPTELLDFKGHNFPQKPILIAVGGKIFDVSDGAKFYGVGSPYNVFAGRVCTRALSLGSLDEKDINDDIDFDSDEVKGQVKFYGEKYKEVGILTKE